MTEPRQTDKAQTPSSDEPDPLPDTDPVPVDPDGGYEGDRYEGD